jgi:hypothetical protein
VVELIELLRPSWGAEKWILEGWNKITSDEKQVIKDRMDELFRDGLPFELKSDKLFYIYTFSLLAQLEVLAIQVPLKFESKMSTVEYRERLRQQLLDEIFHGLVFTKIVYMLCSPYAAPPQYSPNIEVLCNFIRNEDCPKVAIMLLNLIGEGWIEEIFYSLHRFDIAPKVFSKIIEDEHRHVCEADLYRDIGMPDLKVIKPKIAYLEEQLITNIFMQYKYMVSVSALLGVEGVKDFKQSLNKKHLEQLKKINLEPTENWKFFMEFGDNILPRIQSFTESNQEVEMTSIRKVFMTQWSNPSDPTMAGQFNVNVSCLDFFNKKFPAETLTCLMMQAVSLGLAENDSFRNYISFRKIFRSKEAYIGLVVKLPECGDHIATIVFENCHTISIRELSTKIRAVMKMMTYCYKKREHLEKTNPQVQKIMEQMVSEYAYSTYSYPMAGTPFVSLSNIGFCGYSQSMSPLRCNETMKFTLMEVERRPVWDKETQSFKPEDILPVSISADHRLFDGNLPVPKMTSQYFEAMFAKMIGDKSNLSQSKTDYAASELLIENLLNKLISSNIEMGYKTLLFLQTYWFDFLSIEDLLQTQELERSLYPV